MKPAVLFVSHDAYRGGATLMLLNFLRWLRDNTRISLHVLVCSGGGLEPEFEKVARVWYLDLRVGRRAHIRAALRNLAAHVSPSNIVSLSEAASRIARSDRIALIYSNTVVNGRIVDALRPLGCPVLTHVHELEIGIQTRAGHDFDYVKRDTDRFVAVSEAARRNLLVRHGIAAEKVEHVPGFIPGAVKIRADTDALKTALTSEIGAPADARIVGGSGTLSWPPYKGFDLFVQLAAAVRARKPEMPVHFVWLGGSARGDPLAAVRHDVEKAGLSGRVHFVGEKANALDYIAAFDVHALVSREESLSLTMLEAASLGIPTVCFDGHGSREFVEDDAGAVVPYLDVHAMAERVLQLLECESLRHDLGSRARSKVQERHVLASVAPQLLRVIEVTARAGLSAEDRMWSRK
jgi:glycosyltransferase involved in cell wall biosynthesis